MPVENYKKWPQFYIETKMAVVYSYETYTTRRKIIFYIGLAGLTLLISFNFR